jgi:hypothetical protein
MRPSCLCSFDTSLMAWLSTPWLSLVVHALWHKLLTSLSSMLFDYKLDDLSSMLFDPSRLMLSLCSWHILRTYCSCSSFCSWHILWVPTAYGLCSCQRPPWRTTALLYRTICQIHVISSLQSNLLFFIAFQCCYLRLHRARASLPFDRSSF